MFTGRGYIDRWVGVSSEHEDELNALLGCVMARKRKEEVLHELPPKRRSKVHLTLSRAEMAKVTKHMKGVDDLQQAVECAADDGGLPASVLMEAFRLVAEAKVSAVTDWLDETLLNGSFQAPRKAVIFAHHHSVHERINAFLGSKLLADQWIHVTGRTAPAERARALARFQQESSCRFAVLALAACGVSRNPNANLTFGSLRCPRSPLALRRRSQLLHARVAVSLS